MPRKIFLVHEGFRHMGGEVIAAFWDSSKAEDFAEKTRVKANIENEVKEGGRDYYVYNISDIEISDA